MGSPDSVRHNLRKLPLTYFPGHAGVMGNDRGDRLEGTATVSSGLRLGRFEVLRSLRHYLRPQSQGHHTTDRLEERGVERGSARRSSLKGREGPYQTVSKAELTTKPCPLCQTHALAGAAGCCVWWCQMRHKDLSNPYVLNPISRERRCWILPSK